MRAFLLLVCVVAAGCSDSVPTPQPEPPPPPPPPDCTAQLRWTAPTEREDGTPLALDELSQFTVYLYENNELQLTIGIEDVNLIDWEIRNMSGGDWRFEMTATDTNAQESEHSNAAMKTIDGRCTGG